MEEPLAQLGFFVPTDDITPLLTQAKYVGVAAACEATTPPVATSINAAAAAVHLFIRFGPLSLSATIHLRCLFLLTSTNLDLKA